MSARWMFIVDAIMSIPIALLGYLFLPDTPELAKPSLLLSAAVNVFFVLVINELLKLASRILNWLEHE